MGLFNRKSKEVKEKEKLKKKYGYKITICDPLGESPRELETFGANKSRTDDGIVWLVNENKGFKEVFPLDNDFNVKYSKDELEKELKYWENYKPKPNENKLNKESKILELKKVKKAFENPKGSFLKIDKDGMPHIMYVRYRTSFIPLKWNLDFTTIHTPVEPLIKNVLTTQIEKQTKYHQGRQNLLTGGLLFFMVVLIVWTGILAYSSIHWFEKVDTSRVAELQRQIDQTPLYCAQKYGEAGDNFLQASEYAVGITKNLKEQLNPNVQINITPESVR